MSFQHNGFGGPKLTSVEQNFAPDDLIGFLEIFPSHINNLLKKADNVYDLIEVVMDLGRRPQARFHNSEIYLGDREITAKDLQYVVDSIGEFGDDNRAGIEKTLHRVSKHSIRITECHNLFKRIQSEKCFQMHQKNLK